MNDKKQAVNKLIKTKFSLKWFAEEMLGIGYPSYNERWRTESWKPFQIRQLNRALAAEFKVAAIDAMICSSCKGFLYRSSGDDLTQCDCVLDVLMSDMKM